MSSIDTSSAMNFGRIERTQVSNAILDEELQRPVHLLHERAGVYLDVIYSLVARDVGKKKLMTLIVVI